MNWSWLKFSEIFDFQKKSKIKAGDGLDTGKYKFFTSSEIQRKFLNDYLFEEPSLIFGTGGKASIHICREPFSVSTDCFVTIAKADKTIDLSFIYHYLAGNMYILENGFKGAGLKHISKEYLQDLLIPLPPLPAQKRIAEILDKADTLRKKNRQLLQYYDDLAQSLFIDMFGDLVKNEKSGEMKKYQLYEIADITSGIAKNGNIIEDDFVEVPYMRVANVQDSYIVLDEVKTIKVSKKNLHKYLLKYNDILLTEGGDPDKLGRGAVWHNEIEPCIHQNHIFRVRVNVQMVNPTFLSFQIGSKYGKSYFLKAAKQTTGIASINLTQLKKFEALLPSLSLQNQFAQQFQNIEQQKEKVKAQLQQSENLFQALLQQTFNSRLN